MTKPDGNTLTMTMNDDWRLAGLSESDGTSNSYAYYADGVLESAENSAGEKAVFTFDAQGRVARREKQSQRLDREQHPV